MTVMTDQTLTAAERTMLAYALDQAQEKIWSEGGFTDEDQVAVTSLRRLAAEAHATPASTAPLAAGLPLVKGNCPACGGSSLFLGDGGYVTCSRIDCREPDAASTMLERKAAGACTTDTQDDVVVTVHAAPNLTPAAQEALGALVDVAKQQARCGFTHPHPDHPCGTPVAAAPPVGSAEPAHDEAEADRG